MDANLHDPAAIYADYLGTALDTLNAEKETIPELSKLTDPSPLLSAMMLARGLDRIAEQLLEANRWAGTRESVAQHLPLYRSPTQVRGISPLNKRRPERLRIRDLAHHPADACLPFRQVQAKRSAQFLRRQP